MKQFYYKTGKMAGKTMLVHELRDKLKEYPDYMPVFGFWEGCTGYVLPDNFTVASVSKGGEPVDCLLIDVEDY